MYVNSKNKLEDNTIPKSSKRILKPSNANKSLTKWDSTSAKNKNKKKKLKRKKNKPKNKPK